MSVCTRMCDMCRSLDEVIRGNYNVTVSSTGTAVADWDAGEDGPLSVLWLVFRIAQGFVKVTICSFKCN